MTNSSAPGRRPLKTRQWKVFQKLAQTLAVSGVTPNTISVFSVIFALFAGIALAATSFVAAGISQRVLWILSALLVQGRLIANLLDGMVAVEGGKASAVGELYNEIPDRLSDPAILIGAGYAAGGHPILGFTAALLAVFVAYVRAIGASVGVGQVFLGPFAKQQRMALITITCLVCAGLPEAWLLKCEATLGSGIAGVVLLVIVLGSVVTAIRRLLRIARLLKEKQAGLTQP